MFCATVVQENLFKRPTVCKDHVLTRTRFSMLLNLIYIKDYMYMHLYVYVTGLNFGLTKKYAFSY